MYLSHVNMYTRDEQVNHYLFLEQAGLKMKVGGIHWKCSFKSEIDVGRSEVAQCILYLQKTFSINN